MSTIAEQLAALAQIKSDIKDAIIDKGVPVSDSDPFSDYATKIGQISGGGSPSNLFFEWDFTKTPARTLNGVVYNSSGAHFQAGTGAPEACIVIPFGKSDMTLELDTTRMNMWTGYHRRFIMANPESGLIYRNTGKWSFYAGTTYGWQDSSLATGIFNETCTIGVYIDSTDHWHIYKNGTLLWEPTNPLPLITWDGAGPSGGNLVWYIGSSGGQALLQSDFTAMRLYTGNKYAAA